MPRHYQLGPNSAQRAYPSAVGADVEPRWDSVGAMTASVGFLHHDEMVLERHRDGLGAAARA